MKVNKLIAVPAIALATGIGLAACGTTVVQPTPVKPAVTAPAATTPAAAATAPQVIINNNNNPAPASAAPGPAYNNYPAGAFTDSQSLYDSLTNEQQTELQAAPSYDYYSPGNISVSVYCTETSDDSLVYNCTGSDTDGDTGYGDTVTVIDNGNAWSDTGMNWTGPDIYVDGGVTNYWTTPAQSDWSN